MTVTTNYHVFLKIGNHRTNSYAILTDRGCRTQEQFEAVLSIICDDKFLHSDGNPFRQDKPDEQYKCSFAFRWFDKDGYMRSVNVSPKGRLSSHYCSEEPMFEDDVDDVVAKISTIKSLMVIKP